MKTNWTSSYRATPNIQTQSLGTDVRLKIVEAVGREERGKGGVPEAVGTEGSLTQGILPCVCMYKIRMLKTATENRICIWGRGRKHKLIMWDLNPQNSTPLYLFPQQVEKLYGGHFLKQDFEKIFNELKKTNKQQNQKAPHH